MTTENFKIRPDGFNEIKKKMLIKAIPISLIAIAVGLTISFFNPNTQNGNINILPIVVPICLGALAFGLFRGVNRQKELFESYTLTIDDNFVTRQQKNTPTIQIPISDITEIIKNQNGIFTIKGKLSSDIIGVPSQIDNYDKLENILTQIRPLIQGTTISFLQKYRGVFPLLTLAIMATVYLAKDKIIVVTSGTIFIGLMIYSQITIQKSKHIDSKTKRETLWIIVVTASVIGIMYYKLTGQ